MKIEDYVTNDSYSAYEIAKVINKIFADLNIDRTIRPQMMYNYARNAMIVNEKICKESLRKFTNDEVRKFIVRFMKRNNIEFTNENENQLSLFDM